MGLIGADGRWLTNCPTRRYDVERMGTWQHLVGTLETTLDTTGGHLALEKGDRSSSVQIRLWLDDVRLEVLEAP